MNPAHIFLEIVLLLAGPAGEKLETMRETKWEYFESEDKLKGYVRTSSKNLIQAWSKKERVSLIVPCEGAHLYLTTNHIALTGYTDCTKYDVCTTEQRMKIKFNKFSRPLVVNATIWKGNHAVLKPIGRYDKPILRMKYLDYDSVEIEFKPKATHGERVAAIFNLKGFSKALSKCRRM